MTNHRTPMMSIPSQGHGGFFYALRIIPHASKKDSQDTGADGKPFWRALEEERYGGQCVRKVGCDEVATTSRWRRGHTPPSVRDPAGMGYPTKSDKGGIGVVVTC